MIYLPHKCLNYDNLSIKVRIMAADTWHFSFHSLPCWGTSSYLMTVIHGNLEMFFNCTVPLHSMPFCLVYTDVLFEALVWLAHGAYTHICPLDQTLSVFHYSWLFEGLYTYMERKQYQPLVPPCHCPLPVISELSICLLLQQAHKGIINAY